MRSFFAVSLSTSYLKHGHEWMWTGHPHKAKNRWVIHKHMMCARVRVEYRSTALSGLGNALSLISFISQWYKWRLRRYTAFICRTKLVGLEKPSSLRNNCDASFGEKLDPQKLTTAQPRLTNNPPSDTRTSRHPAQKATERVRVLGNNRDLPHIYVNICIWDYGLSPAACVTKMHVGVWPNNT